MLKGWSKFEYALLGGVLLLVCVLGILAVAFLGGFIYEEEVARQDTPTPVSGTEIDPTDPDAETGEGTQTVTLSVTSGAPGTTVTVSGDGWPPGARDTISLVPSNPPPFVVNSAVVDENGNFSVDIIIPSDPRWLTESPIPILVEVEDGSMQAQALLTIIVPGDGPASTPLPIIDPIQPTPTIQPPAANAPQLTVNASALNVRRGPGTNYDIIGVLTLGQKALIVGRNADSTWWQIRFPGVKEGVGWVSAAYVTAENIENVPIVKPPPPPPPPPPTPTPIPDLPPNAWQGEYFNNPDLQGAPNLVRFDPAISFDWGLGSPAPEINADNFSVRWNRTLNFSDGVYRFFTRTDDGVRLWVDGALVINQWYDQSPTTHAADVYLGNGPHHIRMEYYERYQGAVAMLSWERVDLFPDWKAEYFDNPNLQGQPVMVRNEASVNWNWGAGSPAPGVVPADNFSTRWTRTTSYESGDYVLRVRSDDGVRVWIDNTLVIDRWQDGDSGWIDAQHSLPAGLHTVRIEYYERAGDAFISFSMWKKDAPAKPPVAVISAPTEGVVGLPVKFDGSRSMSGDSDITSYHWDFGDGTKANGVRVSHTYSSKGDYQVKLTVTDRNGLSDTSNVTVKINQNLAETTPPIAQITGPSSAQVGQTVTFDGSQSTSLSPIVSYEWNFGDGTRASGVKVSHKYNSANTYGVRLTVVAQNGLSSNDNVQIRINDLGAAELQAKITAPSVGVVNQPVTFSSSQSVVQNPPANSSWDFGDGQSAVGTTVDHTYTSNGTYEVTLNMTDVKGNQSSAKQSITINDDPNAPAPDIAVSPSNQVLVGETVTFDGSNSKPDNLSDSAFVWHFGDGATDIGKVVQHVYQTDGNYTARLTLTSNGQTAEATTNIDVQPNNPPVPVIAGPDPLQAETGQAVVFDASQTQSSSPIARYDWTFGDGTSNTTTNPVVSHTYQSAGAYNVDLVVTDQHNLHGNTQKGVVVRDPQQPSQPPTAVISSPTDGTTVTVGDSVNFDGSGSQPGDHPIATYAWDFGDGSPSASGATAQYVYQNPGTYNVTLTVTDDQGTSNSTSVQLIVNPGTTPPPTVNPPQADIAAPANGSTFEVGDTITFDGSSSDTGGSQNITFTWNFGDGRLDSGPTVDHSYVGPGIYNVILEVTNESGSDQATIQITVNDQPGQPQPTPTPAPNPPVPVIDGPDQGQVGETLLFDASHSRSDVPIVSYAWDFGDGTTDNSGMGVSHSYSAPGSYVITLVVTDQNGLTGQTTHPVQINDQPAPAQPTPTPAPAATPTPLPQPTDTPVPAQPTDTPVPLPTDTPVPVPTDTPVPPLPTNTPVPAPPPPQAVITTPPDGTTVNVGDPVNFDASGSTGSGITYAWDFGDGNLDSGATVTHIYTTAGQWTVTLEVTDQTGATDTAQITITAAASAVQPSN